MTFHPKGLLVTAIFIATLLLAVNFRLGVTTCILAVVAYVLGLRLREKLSRRSPMLGSRIFSGTLAFALLLAPSLRGQQQPAVPADAISSVLDAFRSHSIVALGDANGANPVHAFKLALIRDARFPTVVNDVLVDFGNSLYQDVMDRFQRGENVPYDTLRQTWQNTRGHYAWDAPMYEEFFRAVRAVNASLPRERQLRVLLGSAPVDWDTVRNADDLRKWAPQEHTIPAEIVRREVLLKGRRALINYGLGHLMRRYPALVNPAEGTSRSIVSLLEESTRVFSIYPILRLSGDMTTLQANISSWPSPSLAILRGTVLGGTNMKFYIPFFPDEFVKNDSALESLPMEDQFNAILYLGPPSKMTASTLSPKLCADPVYMKMRIDRFALAGSQGAGFKKLCATLVANSISP